MILFLILLIIQWTISVLAIIHIVKWNIKHQVHGAFVILEILIILIPLLVLHNYIYII